jgi:hypothetical protein
MLEPCGSPWRSGLHRIVASLSALDVVERFPRLRRDHELGASQRGRSLGVWCITLYRKSVLSSQSASTARNFLCGIND